LLEQVSGHRPCCLVRRDDGDKIVDVTELLVDTAVPPPDGGKDAFRDIAERYGAKCKASVTAPPASG
jgi:hypothetical protein